MDDTYNKKDLECVDFRNLVPKYAFITLGHMGMPQGGSCKEAWGPVVSRASSIVAIHGKAIGIFLLLYRSR
jgi:hypothetical protein